MQEYLQTLIQGEAAVRRDNAVKRRISAARFPVVKTLDQFQWSWPDKIPERHIRHLAETIVIEGKSYRMKSRIEADD